MRAPIVPMTPARIPAARAIASSRYVVVVLPLVPVTPSTANRADGSPQAAADTGPMAARTEATCTSAATARPSRRSTSRAAAPAATAAGAWSCPSATEPGTQQKRSPGPMARLSCVTDAISVRGSPRSSSTSTESRSSWSSTLVDAPYLSDWPEEAGSDRPSPRSRVSLRLLPDVPGEVVDVVDAPADELERGAVVVVADFGRVVVVVEPPADLRVVVVVDDLVVDPLAVVVVVDDLVVDPLAVVVVVDDLLVDPLAVVVVVDDLVPGFAGLAVGLVVEVVEALGTFGSSLAGASSRARAGPLGAGAAGGGDPGGGGIRSSRRAYCMIRAKTGADTWPP